MKVLNVLRIVITWVLQGLVALGFVLIGVAKFMSPAWPRSFAHWGYPSGFVYVIGVVEALAGLAILVPRFATHAAIVLLVVMGGAATTHAVWHETTRITGPLVWMVPLVIVALLRKRSARESASRRRAP